MQTEGGVRTMSTTEERAQMLYDKALAELNTYL